MQRTCPIPVSINTVYASFLQAIKVGVSLLVTNKGSLNALYYDADLRSHDNLLALHQHLSRGASPKLMLPVTNWAKTANEPAQRLLRLLCR